MSYGMLLNINGVDINFDSKFTAYKLLKSINTANLFHPNKNEFIERNVWVNTGVVIPESYNYLVMLSRGDCYLTYSDTWSDGKTYRLVTNSGFRYQMNAKREIWASYFCGGSDDYNYIDQMIWILIYPEIKPHGLYGIGFNGIGEGFSGITDIDDFTSVVWSGDVYITPKGISPIDINYNFDKKMLCFFYWEDSNITMTQMAADTDWSIGGYDSYGRYYACNSEGDHTNLKAKMVIFGEKSLVAQEFGFELYNENEQLVFNGSTGVFHQPSMVETSILSINQEIFVPKIKRPMINPRSIGGIKYELTRPGGNRFLYDISFSNTGSTLIVRRGVKNPIDRSRHYAGSFFSEISYPVLDASYYFNFEN
ncbi:hypothetical protein RHO13_03795 [Orbus wheelerorum]|uniref:hypothetical protein n=1 Tax=Orbus wheelerorum TaxID=3074111 RepID=UPI00370D12D3